MRQVGIVALLFSLIVFIGHVEVRAQGYRYDSDAAARYHSQIYSREIGRPVNTGRPMHRHPYAVHRVPCRPVAPYARNIVIGLCESMYPRTVRPYRHRPHMLDHPRAAIVEQWWHEEEVQTFNYESPDTYADSFEEGAYEPEFLPWTAWVPR